MARGKAQTDAQNVDPVDALPNVTLSGSVSAVLSEAVELYRWNPANRKSRAEVLDTALTAWAEAEGLIDQARESLAAKIADAAK